MAKRTTEVSYVVTGIEKTETGRMAVRASFYKIERDLYRKGPLAYTMTVWAALDHILDGAGGIGPYIHHELPRDGNVSPYILVSEEA